MSITKEQQQALDDTLVPREQRLRIGNCNYRLSTTFKPKEPTFQVALDVLSLTPFYQAFLISADRDAPDLPKSSWSKIEDPLFKEEILAFMRQLGYTRPMKSLSDVKVELYLNLGEHSDYHQQVPQWQSLINQHFMTRDLQFQKKQGSTYTCAKDDPRSHHNEIHPPQHKQFKSNRAILPDSSTNQAIKDSEACKTYYYLATGKVTPKPKYVHRSSRTTTDQASQDALSKRLKATAKVAKLGKKKQPAQGLETLSEIALSEAE
ncbi:hypothetical protein Tco_1419524 [Tanacetum coccineum]